MEEVLKRDPNRYEIVIFGAEPHVNYNRIMLSPVLAGEKRFEDIILNDRGLVRGQRASRCIQVAPSPSIDTVTRTVFAEGGVVGDVRPADPGDRLRRRASAPARRRPQWRDHFPRSV